MTTYLGSSPKIENIRPILMWLKKIKMDPEKNGGFWVEFRIWPEKVLVEFNLWFATLHYQLFQIIFLAM